jgi:hypothetical protein
VNLRASLLVSFFSLPLVGLYFGGCATVPPGPGRVANSACLTTDAESKKCGCPVIPTKLPLPADACSGERVVRAALSCGGPEGTLFWTLGNSRPDAPDFGAPQIDVQFMTGSRFQGSLIIGDPACVTNDGTDIDFTFGGVYTGYISRPAGSGITCISQSKMVFSSFNFDLVGNFVHEGKMKATFHKAMDEEVMKALPADLFENPSPAGRCPQWRQLP